MFFILHLLKSQKHPLTMTSTQNWKPIYLVLRPNHLSIYKDAQETKLRHKIHLSDLTAVAFLKDPKQKRRNIFGLFSPSRNFHLEASSHQDAEEWVDLIRKEARIEEEEEEMFLASPGGKATSQYTGFEREMSVQNEQRQLHDERVGSSSPEPIDTLPVSPLRKLPSYRRPSHTMDYSGNESGFYSDLSEPGASSLNARAGSSASFAESNLAVQLPDKIRPIVGPRNASQQSGFDASLDPERVVWQGYLIYLKSKNGIKQWKDLWAVLRPRGLSLYKDDLEYRPTLIIDMDSIRGAVEIDPISKSKSHCLQIITEEKGYRFCAHAEMDLNKCLGAFKSLLVRRGR